LTAWAVARVPVKRYGAWRGGDTKFAVRRSKTHSADSKGSSLVRETDEGCFVEYVNAVDFARLSNSFMEMSDQVVVLTAIVSALVTRADVDYGRLEDCVDFAVTHHRPGQRPALLKKASAVLHDLEVMQKALGVENRKQRSRKKRSVAALAREPL
jgi:hypothetical protein